MVRCDLRELTNIINGWNISLYRWQAWSKVLETRDETESCELRSEFLDSLVHECLLTPASIRDTITSVATAAFHQVRLSIDSSYADYLEGEPKTPEERPKILNRKYKEKRLSRLLRIWPSSTSFIEALRELNTSDYIDETSNYRNLTAHTIGPRLEAGHTRTVTRSLVQAQIHKQNIDGSFGFEDVPGKLAVSYGFGGTPPLNLEAVWAANLIQYNKARLCYVEYRTLLESAIEDIIQVEP